MKDYCTHCKKAVEYDVIRKEVKKYKGYRVNTFKDVGICRVCGNEIEVDELESKNRKRINEEYRNRANIITIEEIVDFRKKYMLSQRELSAILSFGKMTINRYESGFVPTKSKSDYLKIVFAHEDEFIKLVEDAFLYGRIEKKTLVKILNNIEK